MVSADNPAPTNGINPTSPADPNEWAAVTFNLNDTNSVSDVVADLEDSSLRIGMHIISFPDGSSESAVTPEPASLS